MHAYLLLFMNILNFFLTQTKKKHARSVIGRKEWENAEGTEKPELESCVYASNPHMISVAQPQPVMFHES